MCPTRTHFYTSKFCLHSKISRRNLPYTGKFREFRNSRRIRDFASIPGSKCALHGRIWGFSEVYLRKRVSHSRIRFTRESAEICPTRAHFGFKNEAKLHFWRFCAYAQIFKIWLQNFWNIDEIEAELVQQWCSISPTLLNFRVFRNFEMNRSYQLEIEYRKGIDPPSDF